jgi:cold shock CspA family protein
VRDISGRPVASLIMGRISKMPTERGKVVFAQFAKDGVRGFGFITPDDGSVDVWFGMASTQGRTLSTGDEVDFIYHHFHPERGPRAFRVWLRSNANEGENMGHKSKPAPKTSAAMSKRKPVTSHNR